MSVSTKTLSLSLSVPSTASTTTAGSAVRGFGNYDALKGVATLTGITGGTLDVYIQHSFDGGTTWSDVAHFPQLSAGASAITYDFSITLDSTIRTVGKGTSPLLAANTLCAGPWADQLRLVSVTGTGTSGSAQTQTVNFLCWRQDR